MRDKTAFEQHTLWVELSELKEDLAKGEVNPAIKPYLSALIAELDKKKEGANPYYVSESSLDNLSSNLSTIRAYLTSNANQVLNSIDSAFEELASRWPAHNGRYVVDVMKRTFDAVVHDMTDDLVSVEESVNHVKKLEAEYAEKAEEIGNGLAKLEAESKQAIDSIQKDCDQKALEIQADYESKVEAVEKESVDTLAQINADHIGQLDTINAKAQSILKEVQNTANTASGKVIADSYGEYATAKEKQTGHYDLAAIIFAVIGIGLVAFALVHMHAEETSATVFKMATSVASFTVSGFLFRRGSFYQREAKAAKRTELTLKQYRAFIANLDEEEQERITKEIAERIFIKGEIDDKTPTFTEAIAQRGLSEKNAKALAELVKALNTTAD